MNNEQLIEKLGRAVETAYGWLADGLIASDEETKQIDEAYHEFMVHSLQGKDNGQN